MCVFWHLDCVVRRFEDFGMNITKPRTVRESGLL